MRRQRENVIDLAIIWRITTRFLTFAVLCANPVGLAVRAQSLGCDTSSGASGQAPLKSSMESGGYVIGPRDKLAIRVIDEDEIGANPYAVDLSGNVVLPRMGAVHVAGLTTVQAESKLTNCFRAQLKNPIVTVSVAEYRSQPVTVLGAVGTPGTLQIEGRKNLFEVISEAGGLKEEAGNTIQITRQIKYGPLPLRDAHLDSSGEFSVGEVSVRSIVKAQDPSQNIPILPFDVITVPRAEMVYVVGAVNKAGGFVLSERSEMSVLELLSLSQGMTRVAGGKNARILRATEGSVAREEIPIDLNKILRGKSPDVDLRSNDILFVPVNTGKSASLQALQTIVSTGSGIAIYHPY
ncbi:MAG: polysaccharide biosynthesis/export family protein [Terracidiphilus sp.]